MCVRASVYTSRHLPEGGMMTDQEGYDRARKRAKKKLDFYNHVKVYVVVNAFLFLLNWFTAPDYWWAMWPLMGWGIGLVLHAASIYVFNEDEETLEKLTQRELEQQQDEEKVLRLTEFVSTGELANLMDVSVTDVISTLFSAGLMVSINQRLDADTITFVADEYGFDVEFITEYFTEQLNVFRHIINNENAVFFRHIHILWMILSAGFRILLFDTQDIRHDLMEQWH